MSAFQDTLACRTRGSDTYEITREVAELVRRSGIRTGIASVFCPHTSCSLVLMENADPSARHDLQAWLDRLVPAHDRHFTHTLEGPDDMPSHIKMALTRSSETIPVHEGRLRLGTWQGLFLWEHRQAPHARELIVTVIGD